MPRGRAVARVWSMRQQVHDQGESGEAEGEGELECEDGAADSDGDQPASPGRGPPDVLDGLGTLIDTRAA